MVGSYVEDVSEQDQGRDPSPPTQGRKDKSRDAISSFEGRISKLKLGVANTKGIVDVLEQHIHEEAIEDLQGHIEDLQEGMQGSSVHVVSHKEFMAFEDSVLSVLIRLESRVDA